jgi:hypothetical protein
MLLLKFGTESQKLILDSDGEIQTVIHVTSLFEVSLSKESVFTLVVRRARTPADVVHRVILLPCPVANKSVGANMTIQ